MAGLDLVGLLDLDNESRGGVRCARLARNRHIVRAGSLNAEAPAFPAY